MVRIIVSPNHVRRDEKEQLRFGCRALNVAEQRTENRNAGQNGDAPLRRFVLSIRQATDYYGLAIFEEKLRLNGSGRDNRRIELRLVRRCAYLLAHLQRDISVRRNSGTHRQFRSNILVLDYLIP